MSEIPDAEKRRRLAKGHARSKQEATAQPTAERYRP